MFVVFSFLSFNFFLFFSVFLVCACICILLTLVWYYWLCCLSHFPAFFFLLEMMTTIMIAMMTMVGSLDCMWLFVAACVAQIGKLLATKHFKLSMRRYSQHETKYNNTTLNIAFCCHTHPHPHPCCHIYVQSFSSGGMWF